MRALVLVLAAAVSLKNAQAESRVEYVGRLKRDLFRDYDKDLIPFMEKGKAVPVAGGLSMYNMDLTDQGELDFTAWMRYSWTDERLAWDPKEYNGIDQLRIPASQLWVPDFELYNSVEYGVGYFSEQMHDRHQLAIVYSSGFVLYIPPVHGKVQCKDEEFADWPWGDYDCGLKLGSWTYDGFMMNLTKYDNKDNIQVEDFDKNSKLIFTEDSFKNDPLETKYYDCCEEPYMSLNFKFKVQRKWRLTEDGLEKNPNLKKEYEEK